MTRIELLITELVRAAPALDPIAIDELRGALELDGTPLARSIAKIVVLVGEDLVDPGIALPALAEACATLADPRNDHTVREAARYQIDTLQPVPDGAPRFAVPDVALASLRRR